MSHHIGAWMHRPANLLIAPHRDKGCDVVSPRHVRLRTRASHTRRSVAPDNHSLPPPFFCCPSKNLRCGQQQPTRRSSPGTAVVPALPPPLSSSSRVDVNAATERAFLLQSAKSARRRENQGGRSTNEPESRRTGPRRAARTLISCLPALVSLRPPRVDLPNFSCRIRTRVCERVCAPSPAVGPRRLLTPHRRRRRRRRERERERERETAAVRGRVVCCRDRPGEGEAVAPTVSVKHPTC